MTDYDTLVHKAAHGRLNGVEKRQLAELSRERIKHLQKVSFNKEMFYEWDFPEKK